MNTRRSRSKVNVVIDDGDDETIDVLSSSPLVELKNQQLHHDAATTPSPTLCLTKPKRTKNQKIKLTDRDFDITTMLNGVMKQNNKNSNCGSLEATPSPTLCLSKGNSIPNENNLSKYAERMKKLLSEDITTEFHLSPSFSFKNIEDDEDEDEEDDIGLSLDDKCLDFKSLMLTEQQNEIVEQPPMIKKKSMQITLEDSDDDDDDDDDDADDNNNNDKLNHSTDSLEPTAVFHFPKKTDSSKQNEEVQQQLDQLGVQLADQKELNRKQSLQLKQCKLQLSAQSKQCGEMQQELEKANKMNLEMREIVCEFEGVLATQENEFQSRLQAALVVKQQEYDSMKEQLEQELQDAVGIANALLKKLEMQ